MTSASNISRRRHMVLAVFLLIWAAAITATHIPIDRLPRPGVSDKLLHATGYFVLAGAFWLTLRAYEVAAARRILCIFFAMLAYAAIDEMTQPLVGREDSIGDWLADVVGVITALAFLELLALGRAWSPPRPKG